MASQTQPAGSDAQVPVTVPVPAFKSVPVSVPKRPAIIPRDIHYQQSLGAPMHTTIKQSRVLMVGAGGIGCELLKNLVLTGFGEIHIVDLDTIDLSNLNRQFLFRREHIKKPKASVAKEAAERFNPNIKIVAHHANIKDAEFSLSWFRQFRIVFNALDNLDARRHVNRMCLTADVPLVESGTTGFNGQCQVIKKGVTACYDCVPKQTPKSFPVCTIRSTPSQPIHCIVWGKSYLLNEIFGDSEDQSAFDHTTNEDNENEVSELRKESEALRKIRESVGVDNFAQMVFDKVFGSDIVRLRTMDDMWKSRRRPQPLEYETVISQAADSIASKEDILRDGQKVWTLQENLVVFVDSLDRLSKRLLEMKATKKKTASTADDPDPVILFDKDDEDTLDFVTASANIRSTVFGIETKSRFDIKQMAGNIIPAIATTNAIVAGLCVLQAFKVLQDEYSQVKEVFLSPFSSSHLLASDRSRHPNPDCVVCNVYQTSVSVDLGRATLGDLVEDFLRLELGYGDKDIAVNNDTGILYDADETDNLGVKLVDLGIKKDAFLTIIDEDDDDPYVNVVISIQEMTDTDSTQEKPIKASDSGEKKMPIPRRPRKPSLPPAAVESNGSSLEKNGSSVDDVVIIADVVVSSGEAGIEHRKRPRTDDDQPKELKRPKTTDVKISDVVIEDDEGDGTISLIDD